MPKPYFWYQKALWDISVLDIHRKLSVHVTVTYISTSNIRYFYLQNNNLVFKTARPKSLRNNNWHSMSFPYLPWIKALLFYTKLDFTEVILTLPPIFVIVAISYLLAPSSKSFYWFVYIFITKAIKYYCSHKGQTAWKLHTSLLHHSYTNTLHIYDKYTH